MKVEVVEKKDTKRVDAIKAGEIFRYKGVYYMGTFCYSSGMHNMCQENRYYINLSNGENVTFRDGSITVEPFKNVVLLVSDKEIDVSDYE